MTPVLLDCRPGGAWARGHFAGALDADLDRYLSTAGDPGFDPAPGGRHPLPPLERWTRQLGLWGIGPETPVVAYDGARGEMGACRLWWMLRALGHRLVDILDGGIEAGVAAGWTWTEEPTPAPPVRPAYPAVSWALPRIESDLDAVEAAVRSGLVLDVRAPERWRGETEALDPVAGRICGSVNAPLSQNLGPSGRFREAGELKAFYGALLAGRSPGEVVVHCGSGVSACATLYALDKAGFSGAALFVGSYSQWCRSGRPVGKGA